MKTVKRNFFITGMAALLLTFVVLVTACGGGGKSAPAASGSDSEAAGNDEKDIDRLMDDLEKVIADYAAEWKKFSEGKSKDALEAEVLSERLYEIFTELELMQDEFTKAQMERFERLANAMAAAYIEPEGGLQ